MATKFRPFSAGFLTADQAAELNRLARWVEVLLSMNVEKPLRYQIGISGASLGINQSVERSVKIGRQDDTELGDDGYWGFTIVSWDAANEEWVDGQTVRVKDANEILSEDTEDVYFKMLDAGVTPEDEVLYVVAEQAGGESAGNIITISGWNGTSPAAPIMTNASTLRFSQPHGFVLSTSSGTVIVTLGDVVCSTLETTQSGGVEVGDTHGLATIVPLAFLSGSTLEAGSGFPRIQLSGDGSNVWTTKILCGSVDVRNTSTGAFVTVSSNTAGLSTNGGGLFINRSGGSINFLKITHELINSKECFHLRTNGSAHPAYSITDGLGNTYDGKTDSWRSADNKTVYSNGGIIRGVVPDSFAFASQVEEADAGDEEEYTIEFRDAEGNLLDHNGEVDITSSDPLATASEPP